MKWENLELFKKMDRIIYSLTDKYSSHEEEKPKCDHEYQDIEGINTCVRCGVVERCLIDTSYDSYRQKAYKPHRPCERKIYLQNLIRRLSGHYTLEQNKTDIDLHLIPESLTQIRKYLKKNKMNMKNDYYYYRLKNNITAEIKVSHRNNWIDAYKRTPKSKNTKDFLYEKLNSQQEYKIIAEMIKKKKWDKKNAQNIHKEIII
jgi:hypothetical protein